MKAEVRFPRPVMERAARMAELLNVSRAPSERPLDAHAVIRACTARGMGEPLPHGIAPADLDAALRTTATSSGEPPAPAR